MNANPMTIQKKLYLTLGLLTCLAVGTSVTSVALLTTVSNTTQNLGRVTARKLAIAGRMNGTSADLRLIQRGILLRAGKFGPGAVDAYKATYAQDQAEIQKQFEELRGLDPSPESASIINQMEQNLEASRPLYQKFMVQIDASDFDTAFNISSKELGPTLQKIDDDGSKFMVLQEKHTTAATDAAQSQVDRGRWIMVLFVVLCAVVGAAVVFVIRAMAEQLRQAVRQLSNSSDQVSTAATEVSSASQSLAQDTSQQAAMIEETSASAEQINSMAKRNAESSRSAATLVVEAVGSTAHSNQAVADSVLAMDAIAISNGKIAKTLAVIDKIAFQTNILALNAAVEAARAGESGMGFAVVAEEVRNLAQRCAQAAQEIGVLIEESLRNSDAGREKIGSLVQSGQKVGEVFSRLKALVDEVGHGSQEQDTGIHQISSAIQKVEQGTQKNAASAEESAAASQELHAQSEALRHVAKELSLMVGLAVTEGPTRPSHPEVARPALKSIQMPSRQNSPVPIKPRLSYAAPANDADFTEF